MPAFNMSRAVDLSGIAAAAKTAPPPPGASYVLEVDEANFEATMQLSVKHPVIIEMYSPRANAQVMSDELIELANAAGGRYLLARVNVDAAGKVAATFGVQAVPTVLAVIAGQLLPLFQGTNPKAEIQAVLDQVLQAAASAGVSQIAEPTFIDESAEPDPRFAPADAALEKGDYAAAVAEFEKLLAANPADTEAKAGKAQAGLLQRISTVDAMDTLVKAAASPTDIDLQLAAADIELAGGKHTEAFTRLITTIKSAASGDKERIRLRLLDLFETLAPGNAAVAKARRDLMTALF
ncbi:MAG: tetratricopeptide repeat protein [Propionibacteriaceae bacterium]|nr:tetratricopeptide repeat protein [Propionibacteriaceae bacterium]